MKSSLGILFALAAVLGSAQVKRDTLIGTWKPGLEHGKLSGKDADLARKAKEALIGGGMKLNKDGTFGVSLARRVMFGKWRLDGKTLILDVKEVVGMTAQQVAKMPANERTAKFQVGAGGTKLVSMPIMPSPKPNMVWKRPKN